MRVHLLPVGRGRFELYAEPPVAVDEPPPHEASRIRHWLHSAGNQWRRHVDAARLGGAETRLAKWRDAAICTLADSVDEQRTMWSLRLTQEADVLFPSHLTHPDARSVLDRRLIEARRFHAARLGIYAVLFLIPGPNIVAYYLGFQAFGHLQSWRGARQATSALRWTLHPNDELAQLERLTGIPHAARRAEVEAIAERLGLPRLPAFFERAAA